MLEVTLHAQITNLTGIALLVAQLQLASVTADIALAPIIFTAVRPFR